MLRIICRESSCDISVPVRPSQNAFVLSITSEFRTFIVFISRRLQRKTP
jgi:hypothetical protein